MLNKALELNKKLKETLEAKEYFCLKEAISKDNELNSLLDIIQTKQKAMQEALKENDLKKYQEVKTSLLKLKDEFLSHPLIINYLQVKNNLANLIEQIAIIIGE